MKSSCNNKKRKSIGRHLKQASNVYRFGDMCGTALGMRFYFGRDWLLIRPQKKLPKLTA